MGESTRAIFFECYLLPSVTERQKEREGGRERDEEEHTRYLLIQDLTINRPIFNV